MKQYIELSQLNELSDKEKEKLRELWCPKFGDMFVDILGSTGLCYSLKENRIYIDRRLKYYVFKNDCLPLLNIGNMIEILQNSDFGTPRTGLCESSKREEYIVPYVLCLNGSKYHNKSFEADTLCDALFEAIKEIIKE